MGKTYTNAVEIALHGDSMEVYVLEDQGESLGKVCAVVRVTTDKDGNIKVYTVSASLPHPILFEQEEI